MRICFVCLGNICRSTMAEGVMQHLIDQDPALADWRVDSCGTGPWHVGEPPDRRTLAVLRQHGIAYDHRGRQLAADDYQDHDWLLAMDGTNLDEIERLRPTGSQVRTALLRDYDPAGPGPVPDPYYGGEDGFDQAYAMIERSCAAFIARHR